MATRRWTPVKRTNPSGKTAWVARWQDKNGKRRTGWAPDIPGTYKTKREAQAAIEACLEREARGPAKVETVGAYFEGVEVDGHKTGGWLDNHPRNRNTERTDASRVRAVLDIPIDGVPFRDWTFEALRVRHIKVLIDHMLRVQGRAYTGVNAILGTLASMTRDAIEDEVAVGNPFRDVRKVRKNDPRIQKQRRPIRVFTWQQMHAFARTCADATVGSPEIVAWRRVYAEPMIRTLSDCGLRVGELFALCLSDLSFTDETLEVRWSVSIDEILPGTKTDHGELDAGRVVPVPPDLLRMLDGMPKQTIVRRGGQSERLLFPTPTGGVWTSQYWRRAVWVPGQRASGLDMRPHELRHSHISLLRAAGIDPVDLARASGHTVETATAVYTHALGRSFDAIRNAVGE